MIMKKLLREHSPYMLFKSLESIYKANQNDLFIATNLYEAIVFDDISEYNKFNLVIYSNGAEIKPPMCIELDDFQRVTDTLVRFTVNYTYPLEHSTWKLECYE